MDINNISTRQIALEAGGVASIVITKHTKWYSKYQDSGLAVMIINRKLTESEVTDLLILVGWCAYGSDPGAYFQHAPYWRSMGTRTIIKMSFGYDC